MVEQNFYGFVNYTGKPEPDEHIRRFVRQNAMRRYRTYQGKNGRMRQLPPLQYALEVPDNLFEVVESMHPVTSRSVCNGPSLTISHDQSTIPATAKRNTAVAGRRFAGELPAVPLLCYLGASQIDPFHVLPTERGSCKLDEAINHWISILLPGLWPVDHKGFLNPLPKLWLPEAFQDPLLFHTTVYFSMAHLEALQQRHTILRLYQKECALKEINKTLADLCPHQTEYLILAILRLASYEFTIEEIEDDNPFYPPLKSLEWLNVFGRMKPDEACFKAIAVLVQTRGGFASLRLPLLARSISSTAIHVSTRTMSASPFPIITIAGPPWTSSRLSVPHFDREGRLLRNLNLLGISNDMLNVAYDLWEITGTIKQHINGVMININMSDLMDMRSTIQHRLLSLPTLISAFKETQQEDYLYEVYRLSLLLYSIAVIYPIPSQKTIRYKLVVELQSALEKSSSSVCWRKLPEALFWPLYFGAIAASHSPERQWFIDQICTLNKILGLRTWMDAREIMNSFLWLDSACEPGGKVVWAEICNARPIPEVKESCS